MQKRITICSLYCPPVNTTAASFKNDLQKLIEQLPKPFLLLGDFNAHNPLWFCEKTDQRGAAVESIILENDVYFLDKNNSTHYYQEREQLKVFSYRPLSLLYKSGIRL